MGITIIDKRVINHDRSIENRQRFLRRVKQTIKEQLPDIMKGRNLKDLASTGGNVVINKKTIKEPYLRHGIGGNIDRVLPGNDRYVKGDRISKPRDALGGNGTSGEDTEDDLIIELSRDEFLNYFFEDLELPNLLQVELSRLKETKRENAGFQPDGSPNRLSIIRSYRQSLSRRLTLRSTLDAKIEAVQSELDQLNSATCDECVDDCSTACKTERISLLTAELDRLTHRRETLPLFEDMDLRYRLSVAKEVPVTHATMIMIMDNSGSMGLKEKTIARKFFWLLYSFLQRQYDEVDMIFISHTESAEELTEDEFFNTHVSGGTVVSSALDLTSEIIESRLVNKTNIYVAQVSDGDNTDTDNGTCAELLEDDVLPYVRYFAYIQVDDYHDPITDPTSNPSLSMIMNQRGLWKSYQTVAEKNSKLQIKRVYNENDIYPVFRELFIKK